MLQYINYRIRVTIQDGRQLVGKFMAFDCYMNLIIGDCEEFRKLPPAKGVKKGEEHEDRRTLGLVLLRAKAVGAGGSLSRPGLGRAARRGILSAPLVAQAQPGLFGPVREVDGHAPGMMPYISRPLVMGAPPMGYALPVVKPVQMGFPGQMPRSPPP
ncbi:small nuclear ribonucleoprotein-associated protein B'-like protein [Tanacetum coccineum]